MKRIIISLFLVFLGAAFLWCAIFYGINRYKSTKEAQVNTQNIAKIKIGMNKVELLKIMGVPARVEAFMSKDKLIEFLFYRTNGLDNYLKDHEDNFTPIAIDNSSGLVISFGNNLYKEIGKGK